MTPEQIQIVKSTVPVLQVHGEEITRVFYRELLDAHPELNSMFNAENQKDGSQSRRLAGAILGDARDPRSLGGRLWPAGRNHDRPRSVAL